MISGFTKRKGRLLLSATAIFQLWGSSGLAGVISCEYIYNKTQGAYFSISEMNDSAIEAVHSNILNEKLSGMYFQATERANQFLVKRFGDEVQQEFSGELALELARTPGSKHDRCQMQMTVSESGSSGPEVHREFFEVIALSHGGGELIQTLWIGQRDEEGGQVFYVLDRESVPF
jgi:hypothetical protein